MSRKSKKHGEIMSDQENINQEIDENKVQKETVDIKKTSFIDSLFFSTGTIAVLGIVFVVTSSICGWYVFTLSDREIQIQKSEESLRDYDKILETAKIKKVEEQNLIMSIAEKKSDVAKLKMDTDVYTKAKSTSQTEFNKLEEENNKYRTILEVVQGRLANANAQIPDLTSKIYDLEQEVKDLTAQIDVRKTELKRMTDKHGSFNDILLSTQSRLDKINTVESNFSEAQKEINSIISQLEKMKISIQSSSTDLKSQISDLESYNNSINNSHNKLESELTSIESSTRNLGSAAEEMTLISDGLEAIQSQVEISSSNLNEEISDLENYNNRMGQVSQTTNNLSESLTNSNRQLANRLTRLNQSTGDLQKVVTQLREVSDNIEDSEGSFEDLTNTIETADRALADLVSQVNRFQKDIDDDSIKKINESIEEISKELKDLKENLEKSQN